MANQFYPCWSQVGDIDRWTFEKRMADTGFLLGITHAQLEELTNLGVGVDVVAEQFNGFNARFGLKVQP